MRSPRATRSERIPASRRAGPRHSRRRSPRRSVAWPAALAALGTHDSKRGPDVRARLLVLAELGEEWLAAVRRFEVLESDIRPDGAIEIDANARWLLWQTLVGAWPLEPSELPQFADRVRDYALKAAREAKERTSWTEPDEAYEHALVDLVARALDTEGALFAALREVVERVAWPGAVNGLSLALLLMAAPGLPDIYQGTERWSFSLVDPDNRRPVDLAGARPRPDRAVGRPRLVAAAPRGATVGSSRPSSRAPSRRAAPTRISSRAAASTPLTRVPTCSPSLGNWTAAGRSARCHGRRCAARRRR